MSVTVNEHPTWPILQMDVEIAWRGPRGQAVVFGHGAGASAQVAVAPHPPAPAGRFALVDVSA